MTPITIMTADEFEAAKAEKAAKKAYRTPREDKWLDTDGRPVLQGCRVTGDAFAGTVLPPPPTERSKTGRYGAARTTRVARDGTRTPVVCVMLDGLTDGVVAVAHGRPVSHVYVPAAELTIAPDRPKRAGKAGVAAAEPVAA